MSLSPHSNCPRSTVTQYLQSERRFETIVRILVIVQLLLQSLTNLTWTVGSSIVAVISAESQKG